VACPGLTRESDPKIDRYLRRVTALGGGAPSRSKIAKTLWPSKTNSWKNMKPSEQHMVLRREELSFLWRNVRGAVGAVFSSCCEKNVEVHGEKEPFPCAKCTALRSLHTFQVALNRSMPSEENMKFVNFGNRCPELGEIFLKHKGVRKLIEEVCMHIIQLFISLQIVAPG
jgi:hypothetical protein